MAHKKKGSKVIDAAEKRASSMASISETLDLGEGRTLAGYRRAITDTKSKLNAHNKALSAADSTLNVFNVAERSLRDLSERMLSGVASQYGKDSDEYEKAGGVRKSERKRPVRRRKLT